MSENMPNGMPSPLEQKIGSNHIQLNGLNGSQRAIPQSQLPPLTRQQPSILSSQSLSKNTAIKPATSQHHFQDVPLNDDPSVAKSSITEFVSNLGNKINQLGLSSAFTENKSKSSETKITKPPETLPNVTETRKAFPKSVNVTQIQSVPLTALPDNEESTAFKTTSSSLSIRQSKVGQTFNQSDLAVPSLEKNIEPREPEPKEISFKPITPASMPPASSLFNMPSVSKDDAKNQPLGQISNSTMPQQTMFSRNQPSDNKLGLNTQANSAYSTTGNFNLNPTSKHSNFNPLATSSPSVLPDTNPSLQSKFSNTQVTTQNNINPSFQPQYSANPQTQNTNISVEPKYPITPQATTQPNANPSSLQTKLLSNTNPSTFQPQYSINSQYQTQPNTSFEPTTHTNPPPLQPQYAMKSQAMTQPNTLPFQSKNLMNSPVITRPNINPPLNYPINSQSITQANNNPPLRPKYPINSRSITPTNTNPSFQPNYSINPQVNNPLQPKYLNNTITQPKYPINSQAMTQSKYPINSNVSAQTAPPNSHFNNQYLPSMQQQLPPMSQPVSGNLQQQFIPLNPAAPANLNTNTTKPPFPDGSVTQRPKYPVDQSIQPQQNFSGQRNYPTNQMPNFNTQQNYMSQSVVNQGFSKLWGVENSDLLQEANVLPPTKIEPPKIMLGNEALNMANCGPEVIRSTITKIPESASLLQKSRLPLGILIHPFCDLSHLAVIQCSVIVRCRACRTYINPFVSFVDTKRWKCNLCYRVNELPEEFQYDPISKTYGDPSRRPEIRTSTIEYIAPAEYMLRPPQPAVYLFLLDISRLAVENGYLGVFCSVLLQELDELPGDSRTQIGFIAYDSNLHFYSFAEGLSQPHEMLVLDIDDVFLPHPDNLLVNLRDRKELLKDFLNHLPNRYANTYDTNSSLGAALQAGHKMISATGGRITVFQASLPNVGPGMLTAREDPNQRSSSEVTNLKPANDFYKRLALDCSSQQIAVDLFIVNSQYVDIATISGISRFSGGCIHHFPLFKSNRPVLTEGFQRCLKRYLTRKIGFEAVMRIRCTRGMSIHTFHGNFFVRSTDLLSLPNVNPDSGFGMQVSIEENLSDVQQVCFQAALLYTSSKGERRIRVHTLCLPVVSSLQEIINSADQQCIVGLLAKMAVDRSMESSLSDAREAFINVAIDIFSSYKLSLNMGSNHNGLLAPGCLKLLPLYISALLKHTAFRTGTSTRLDDRVKAMIDMKIMPLQYLLQKIYPDLYPIHSLETSQVVLNTEEQQVHVPPLLQLSSRLVDCNGAYLMDSGDHMIIYICSAVSLKFINEAFGVPNFSCVPDLSHELPVLENETSKRLHALLNYLNDDRPYPATLQIIKDNSPQRTAFLEKLIEDRFENTLSYHEFLQHVKAQVK